MVLIKFVVELVVIDLRLLFVRLWPLFVPLRLLLFLGLRGNLRRRYLRRPAVHPAAIRLKQRHKILSLIEHFVGLMGHRPSEFFGPLQLGHCSNWTIMIAISSDGSAIPDGDPASARRRLIPLPGRRRRFRVIEGGKRVIFSQTCFVRIDELCIGTALRILTEDFSNQETLKTS